MRHAPMLAILLAFAGCAAGPATNSPKAAEIFYRKDNTSVVDVFNLGELSFHTLDIGYLERRDGRYGEFGGRFEICSDAEFFCLIGGISAAIPKKFEGQTSWQFAGISCRTDTPLAEGAIATIDCSRGNWSNRLTYSQADGITTYKSAAEPGAGYTLVASPGLLARNSGTT